MILLLLTCFILQLTSGSGIEDPIQVTTSVGKEAILPCHKIPFEATEYIVQWHKEDDILPIYILFKNWPPYVNKIYSDRISMLSDTSLHLKEVSKLDESTYECHVFLFHEGLPIETNITKVHLKVEEDFPVFTVHPNSIEKNLGDTLEVKCPVEINNKPRITYRWLHNNSKLITIPDLHRRSKELPNGILIITSLRSNDEGNYTCQVYDRNDQLHSANIELHIIQYN